jgi:hypothetical protein
MEKTIFWSISTYVLPSFHNREGTPPGFGCISVPFPFYHFPLLETLFIATSGGGKNFSEGTPDDLSQRSVSSASVSSIRGLRNSTVRLPQIFSRSVLSASSSR